MIGRTRASGEQDTYQYDGENRLVAVTTTIPSAATMTIQDTYDPDGNRVQEVTNGITVTNYLVDTNLPLAQVVLETNGAGVTLASYVHGADLISMRRGNTTSYYHYDGGMSVRQLTDASQTITDQYIYDAFGTLLASSGTTQNNYLYTGQQYDANIGFYYLRARYYGSETGRFMSIDPLEGVLFEPITLHRYLYAGDDPLNNADPSGEEFAPLVKIALAVSMVLGGNILEGYYGQSIDFHDLLQNSGVLQTHIDVRATHIGKRESLGHKLPVWHLFIVYFDQATHLESFFRGGPGGGCTEAHCPAESPNYGYIVGTHGAYDPDSVDWDPFAPTETVLEGSDAQGKDTCFTSELARIDAKHVIYNPTGPNSNTVASTLLHACGIPHRKPVWIAPGWGDPDL
jgi:RHS repeat-associated protein